MSFAKEVKCLNLMKEAALDIGARSGYKSGLTRLIGSGISMEKLNEFKDFISDYEVGDLIGYGNSQIAIALKNNKTLSETKVLKITLNPYVANYYNALVLNSYKILSTVYNYLETELISSGNKKINMYLYIVERAEPFKLPDLESENLFYEFILEVIS